MEKADWKSSLQVAFEHAVAYLDGLPDRPVPPTASLAELRTSLGVPLPDGPQPADEVVAALAAAAEPGVIASGAGRFFGFVIGGSTPAALAADWLTSAWDQNAGLYVIGPSASVVEEVAGGGVVEVLGLPRPPAVGFLTRAAKGAVSAPAPPRPPGPEGAGGGGGRGGR